MLGSLRRSTASRLPTYARPSAHKTGGVSAPRRWRNPSVISYAGTGGYTDAFDRGPGHGSAGDVPSRKQVQASASRARPPRRHDRDPLSHGVDPAVPVGCACRAKEGADRKGRGVTRREESRGRGLCGLSGGVCQ
jgi:hypothetical protein